MHRNLMPKFTAVVLLLAIAWTVSAAHDWDGSPGSARASYSAAR